MSTSTSVFLVLVVAVLIGSVAFAQSGKSKARLSQSAGPDIGVNMLLFTTYVTEDHLPIIEQLAVRGAKGIELPLFQGSVEHYENLGAIIQGLGLEVTTVATIGVDQDPSSLDPDIRQAGIDFIKERIDWTAAAGAKVLCGPLVLPWGWVPEGLIGADLVTHVEQHLDCAVDSMREVAEYAESKGIRLALEPLTHWEHAGLNKLSQVAKFVEQVDRPAFGILIDTSHETLDGEGPAVFERLVVDLACQDKLFHIHISAPDRGDVINSWIPWNNVFKALISVNYQGSLVIEIFDAAEPFASGVHLNRPAFEDPVAVVHEAILKTQEEWQLAQ